MSLRIINAVHDSRIEPRLRFLAVTLAFYADDEGREIYPGIDRLMRVTGLKERTIREGLQALAERHIIVRDGFRGHTRRFRFDIERLDTYKPAEVTRNARRARLKPQPNGKPNRTTLRPGAGLANPETLRPGAVNPAAWRRQPCGLAPSTLRHGAAHKEDLQDLQDLQDLRTGADAPNAFMAEVRTEKTKAEEVRPEEAMTDETRPQYLAVAKLAIRDAYGERKDDLPTIRHYFKCRCEEQRLSYDTGIATEAIAEALAAQEKSKQEFLANLRAFGGIKSMPPTTGYRNDSNGEG